MIGALIISAAVPVSGLAVLTILFAITRLIEQR